MPISIELYHDYYTREKEDAHAINFSTTFEKINYFFDQFQCVCHFDRKSIKKGSAKCQLSSTIDDPEWLLN